MEWLTGIRTAISFIEDNLKEDISVQDVAAKVYISPIFLQRGFSLMTGYNVGEYIRNRRLYQAAIDLRSTEDPVIDIAYSYCYETPESFTKAFSRFHGVTPSQVHAPELCSQSTPRSSKSGFRAIPTTRSQAMQMSSGTLTAIRQQLTIEVRSGSRS